MPDSVRLSIEKAIQSQNYYMIQGLLEYAGVSCEIYQPISTESLYDEEDQTYTYPSDPEYSDNVLISGLHNLKFGPVDRWTGTETILYLPVNIDPDEVPQFIPEENAKVIILQDDVDIIARVYHERSYTGLHLKLLYAFELIPFT